MKEDKVKCLICKKEIFADDFAEHAITMHENKVFELISDDVIIEELSEWIDQ